MTDVSWLISLGWSDGAGRHVKSSLHNLNTWSPNSQAEVTQQHNGEETGRAERRSETCSLVAPSAFVQCRRMQKVLVLWGGTGPVTDDAAWGTDQRPGLPGGGMQSWTSDSRDATISETAQVRRRQQRGSPGPTQATGEQIVGWFTGQ